jgi:hypothetical protein
MRFRAPTLAHRIQSPPSRNGVTLNHSSGPFVFLSMLATILAIVGLSSCAGFTNAAAQPKTPNTGVLSVNSPTINFGSVAIGSTAVQSVTVTNVGTSTVDISAATLAGAGFTVMSGNPSGSMAVGQGTTVQVQFAPASAGAATGSLTVVSDASNSPLVISFSGTGTQPGLAVSPASVNFGNVLVGQNGTQTVKLTNTGTASVVVNLATVSGDGFGVSGLSLPSTIAAGQSLSFSALFAPTATGNATGSITFTDNAPGSPQTLALVGNGVAAVATLVANPTTVAFGNVATGSSGQQTITLTNTGSASATISQVTTSGTGFSITGLTAPVTIGAGLNVNFTAQFAPTATGSASGSIAITSNASDATLSIPLSGTGTEGGLSANPTSVNFGNVLLGTTGSTPVTLTNSGSANVTISAASASGTGFGISGLSTPLTLTPGQNTSFTAKFTPASTGSLSGSVSITSNAPGSPMAIALSGTGVQAQLSANPASVAFGNVAVGSSAPQTISLTNGGTASVTISAAVASGSGFSLSGLSLPLTILAGQNATFTAQFAPTSAGSATGSISITSNAPSSPLSIPLTGTGTQPQLGANPTSVAFGNVAVGSSAPQTITLTNSGAAGVTISAAVASGAGFSLSGLSLPLTIPAGQNIAFTAQFAPTSAGSATGSISITSNAPSSPLSIPLSGTGTQPQLGANPTSAPFGNVTVGNSNSQTINLTNTGTAPVTISQAQVSGAGFSISGITTPLTINAGKSSTFNAVFTPTASGSVAGTILLTSNAPGSPLTISLSGTGVAATFLLSLSTNNLSFGNVNVGNNGQMTVSLTNSGNSSVTVSAVNVTGAGFTVSGVSSGETLTPSQSLPVTVEFAPTAAGAVTGSVNIASNATNSPATITLSGTGVQPHTVGLSWNASTSSVVGYNVYRGTTDGGPYPSKLTTSPVAATAFTDTGVLDGETYYYVVTAVDSSGDESVASNQASAPIP